MTILSDGFFIVVQTMIFAAIIAACYRVFRGPSLPDRVIALDMIGILAVAMIAVFSVAIDNTSLLSVAVVAALILFLGTAAFAIYIERRGPEPTDAERPGDRA